MLKPRKVRFHRSPRRSGFGGSTNPARFGPHLFNFSDLIKPRNRISTIRFEICLLMTSCARLSAPLRMDMYRPGGGNCSCRGTSMDDRSAEGFRTNNAFQDTERNFSIALPDALIASHKLALVGCTLGGNFTRPSARSLARFSRCHTRFV